MSPKRRRTDKAALIGIVGLIAGDDPCRYIARDRTMDPWGWERQREDKRITRATLTVYVETAELGYHRVGVDLAHVTIPVGFLQLANMQAPRAVDDLLRRLAAAGDPEGARGRAAGPGTSAALVRHRDTRIMRHGPRVHREDRLVRSA